MQIIQVIDLDGTTVKVDNTNPTEPKIASALHFDTDMRKNVAIGDITELVFAKPLNANVEAICVGYKGTDGKYYGITGNGEESAFTNKAYLKLIFTPYYTNDGVDGYTMAMQVCTVGSGLKGKADQEELNGKGAKVTEPLYIRIGEDTKLYRFEPLAQNPATAQYVLTATERYTGTRPSGDLTVEVSTSADINDTTHTASVQLYNVDIGMFKVTAPTSLNHIQSVFGPVNRA